MVRKRDPPALNRRGSDFSSGSLQDYRQNDARYSNSFEKTDPLESIDRTLLRNPYESDNESQMIDEARQCIISYRERKTKRDTSPGEEAPGGESTTEFLRRCEEEARQRILLYQMSSKTQRGISFADEYDYESEIVNSSSTKNSLHGSHSLRQPEKAEEPVGLLGIKIEEEECIVETLDKEPKGIKMEEEEDAVETSDKTEDLAEESFGKETNKPLKKIEVNSTPKKPDPVPIQSKPDTVKTQQSLGVRTQQSLGVRTQQSLGVKTQQIPGRYIRTSSFLNQEKEEEKTAKTVSTAAEDDHDYGYREVVHTKKSETGGSPGQGKQGIGPEVEERKQEQRHKVLDPYTLSKMIAESDGLYSRQGKVCEDELSQSLHALPGFWGNFLEFLTCAITCSPNSASGGDDALSSLRYEMPLLSIQDGDEDIEAWGAGDSHHPSLKPAKIAKAINFSSKRLDRNYPLIALYDENKLRQEVHQVEMDVPDERFEQMVEAEGYYDEFFEARQGVPDAVVVKPKKVDDISVLEDNSIADSSYRYADYRTIGAWSLSPKRKRRLRDLAKALEGKLKEK